MNNEAIVRNRIVKSFPPFFYVLSTINRMERSKLHHNIPMSGVIKRCKKVSSRYIFDIIKFLEAKQYIYWHKGLKQNSKVYKMDEKGINVIKYFDLLHEDAIEYMNEVEEE